MVSLGTATQLPLHSHTLGVSPATTIAGQHPLVVLYHNNKGCYRLQFLLFACLLYVLIDPIPLISSVYIYSILLDYQQIQLLEM